MIWSRRWGADSGISTSEVSRICADLESEVSTFRDRSLADQQFPYVFVDATCCTARVNRRVVSQAVVIATGVCGDGRREVLGFSVGDSEDGAFWTQFLRSLKARGLGGVQLVIADAHLGLRQAVQPPWPAPRSSAAGSTSSVRVTAARGSGGPHTLPDRHQHPGGGAGGVQQAMLVMVHLLHTRQPQVMVLNFSDQSIAGRVKSKHLAPGSAVTDMLTDQVIAEVDHEHTFAVSLEPHQSLSLLTDPALPQDGQDA